FANPEKEVAPSLPASTPAMTLNHKIKGKGISARFRLALTDSRVRFLIRFCRSLKCERFHLRLMKTCNVIPARRADLA
ncbi:hypothetical protein, partial [Rhizobium sp. N122]|uniref:hypothetical protein n=1 Tax=Rhizobium sp. N122 TaxID=1764272 RepID=UPI001AECA99D